MAEVCQGVVLRVRGQQHVVPHFEGAPTDGGELRDEAVGEGVGVQVQGLVVERTEEGAGIEEVLDLLEGGDGSPCCEGGCDFGAQFGECVFVRVDQRRSR
jgi:hypothetical protein